MLKQKPGKGVDFLRLGLALLVAVLAAGVTALCYLNRDFLFEWNRVLPVGAFTAKEDPALGAAAIAFAQEKIARPEETCVGQWVGRDEKYIYMAIGCAKLEEKFGEPVTSGDSNFRPTRFLYRGEEVKGWEQPDETQYGNSMRRLFPKAAQDLLRLNRDLFIQLLKQRQVNPEAPAEPAPGNAMPEHHDEPVSSAL